MTPRSLRALNISEVDERVYRVLLRHPGSTWGELDGLVGIGRDNLHSALAGLERAGLITPTLGQRRRFLPTAPDVGLEALIRQQETSLEQVRIVAGQLMADFHRGREAQPPELVEVVTGADTVHRRFEQLQLGAKRTVEVLDTPPYAGPGGTPNRIEIEAMARGVVYRGIYDRAALEAAPGTIDAVARYVAAGEQARYIAHLPFKLGLFDRELAYIPLTIDQPDVSRFIVVRGCSLLDAVVYLFDLLWAQAVRFAFDAGPATSAGSLSPDRGPDDGPGPDDRRLLRLLAAGVKDEAVARDLGLSHRTARRRIAALMAALGAESRFQAGVQAARKGWL
jgi:DNA-binding CsgD family transcriptional regulator